MKNIVDLGHEVARQVRNKLEKGETPTKVIIDTRHLQNLAADNISVATGTMNEGKFAGLSVEHRENQWSPIVE